VYGSSQTTQAGPGADQSGAPGFGVSFHRPGPQQPRIRLDKRSSEGVVVTLHGGVAGDCECCSCPCPASDYILAVSPSSVSLLPGLSAQFEADDWKTNCNGPYFYADWTKQVGWSSSAPSVASVNSTGLVTASSGGSTTITASTVGVKYG